MATVAPFVGRLVGAGILIGLFANCGFDHFEPQPGDDSPIVVDGGQTPSSDASSITRDAATVTTVDGGTPSNDSGAPFAPSIRMLMGANGWPGNAAGLGFWSSMGLRFSRIEIGPLNSTDAADLKAKGYFDSTAADANVMFNNASGVSSMVLLAYTAPWNGLSANDPKSAPKDDSVWTDFVEAVVKHYSAAPFNVHHFQIWNEAAGPLSGGLPQATFWHGPGDSAQPYANAMPDYIDLVHIPAAKIIRKYGAYVVYGGWPDQGGIDNYETWLEHKSTAFEGNTMLDWTDYLDTHYLGTGDMKTLYTRYVSTGKIRGVWQTEVGFDYMKNHNYIADFFFDLATMALSSGWSDPDQFVSMVYHWSGGQTFMLTGQDGSWHDSGRSLQMLAATASGTLAPFTKDVAISAGAKVKVLYSDKNVVFQFSAPQGVATVDVDGLPEPAGFKITYKEAVLGTDLAASITSSSWSAGHLSVKLNVPAGRLDENGTLQNTMGYIVVAPN